MDESDVKKLPGNVRPLRYAIDLAPDLEAFTFDGSVSIEVEVVEATERITLNAAELDIASAVVTLADGRSVEGAVEIDEDEETAVFSFGETLPAGRASLACDFTGVLNDQLRGFYRSEYVDEGGEKRYMATTQFEATDARRAFPCWDEPSLKATFEVTLTAPKDLTTLSNMPVAKETVEGPLKTVRFQETPRMSTYLLAFVVGDLASVDATGPGGTLVRVFTTRGKEEQGRFALENSVKLLHYFNDYFGIPYPLPKMDHVAVPDFAAGAMENWGCIIYRETALLFEEGQSAAVARQRIMQVVAHEMAHMWFGDLVTMAWWDDLWLNESFASWMGDKGVDVLFPEWRMWTQFVSQDTNAALSLDGLESSHPIEVPVKDPAEIREIFDAISYSKGGSVLRMLEQYLGADTFRDGLRAYIAEHQYANARTEHLWQALEAASGEPVTRIMNSWTQQMGYPVVDVTTERSGDGARVGLSQRRFLYSHLLGGGTDDPSVWETPVLALTPDGGVQASLLSEREGAIDVPRGRRVDQGQRGADGVLPGELWGGRVGAGVRGRGRQGDPAARPAGRAERRLRADAGGHRAGDAVPGHGRGVRRRGRRHGLGRSGEQPARAGDAARRRAVAGGVPALCRRPVRARRGRGRLGRGARRGASGVAAPEHGAGSARVLRRRRAGR